MPRLPVNLSDEAKEWVEEEAAERGRSQSDVVAELVERAREDDGDQSDSGQGDLRKRLGELEERVEELEEERFKVNQTDSDKEPYRIPADHDQEIEDAVAQMDIPGRAKQTERLRRQKACDYLRWVQEKGEVKRADVIDEFSNDSTMEVMEYIDGETFWEKLGRDILKDASEAGLIEVDGRTYRWVDGD